MRRKEGIEIIYMGARREGMVSPCICRIQALRRLTCFTTATDHAYAVRVLFEPNSPHASEILTEPLRWEAYMPLFPSMRSDLPSFSPPHPATTHDISFHIIHLSLFIFHLSQNDVIALSMSLPRLWLSVSVIYIVGHPYPRRQTTRSAAAVVPQPSNTHTHTPNPPCQSTQFSLSLPPRLTLQRCNFIPRWVPARGIYTWVLRIKKLHLTISQASFLLG